MYVLRCTSADNQSLANNGVIEKILIWPAKRVFFYLGSPWKPPRQNFIPKKMVKSAKSYTFTKKNLVFRIKFHPSVLPQRQNPPKMTNISVFGGYLSLKTGHKVLIYNGFWVFRDSLFISIKALRPPAVPHGRQAASTSEREPFNSLSSCSYEGEYATKSEEKRALQND